MRRFLSHFDARDAIAFLGFLALYAGLAGRFGHDIALIAVGVLVLAKVWRPWA